MYLCLCYFSAFLCSWSTAGELGRLSLASIHQQPVLTWPIYSLSALLSSEKAVRIVQLLIWLNVALTGLHLVGISQRTAPGEISSSSGTWNIWGFDGQVWERSILPYSVITQSFPWIVSFYWRWCCVCYMHGWRVSECECYPLLWLVQSCCTSGKWSDWITYYAQKLPSYTRILKIIYVGFVDVHKLRALFMLFYFVTCWWTDVLLVLIVYSRTQ